MKNIVKGIALFTILGLTSARIWAQKTDDHNFEMAKNLEIFHEIVSELDRFYVDTINPGSTIETGIQAMLRGIDPYTEYYPEKDMKDLKMMTTGKYAGIGAVIRQYTGRDYIYIDEPYEGMPAARYGLKAGDEILRINGESMKGKASAYVSDHLRGEADSKLTVTVRRPGVPDSLDIEVVRSVIALPAVPYYGMYKGYGYILLDQFTENCSKNVMKAFVELKEQGAKGIILDLRGNGGGLLNEAVEIVGLFVPKGTKLVETRGKVPQAATTYYTQRNPIDEKMPLVVLTDDQSASASEIVAGSLQDLDRAVIVGVRTFGKGLVQTTRMLPFNGTLKVTTAKYYIPSGRCIQEIDYSKRNEKGQAQHIPDSLTKVFYTAAGRPVRDGGGIRPDVQCKQDTMPDILYYLAQNVVLFDFVNDWCTRHESIAPAGEFKLTDDDYNAFKEFVCNSEFKFESNSGKALESLKKIAEREGLADKAQDEFKSLESKLQYDLRNDLDVFRKDLERVIEMEIIIRYYYQRGVVIYNMNSDRFLDEAVNILTDRKRYDSILSSPE
ncbi:MAG: S41 family peptidase [Bacteroidaceae bacterium]|nr:S41 family peptidase [Bacteroidaceae bacterium]MBR3936701.1 S41 family peptidase [Bacteroidaceae bacterium]